MDFEEDEIIDDGHSSPLMFSSPGELENYNSNLVETNVKMIGNKTIIAEVVQLLSYIRHALRNNVKTELNVKLGTTVANVDFMFDVNGMQVPDLVIVPETSIN